MAIERAVLVRVLGPAQLRRDGVVKPVPSVRQRRIVAVLAAAAGRTVTADALVDAVWGINLPEHPADALQTQISRLRGALGGPATVRLEAAGYALGVARDEVDAWVFEDAVAAAGGDAEALAAALAMWHGAAFADAEDHPLVQPVAAHLDEVRRDAVEELAAARLSAGDPAAALAVIEPLLVEDPYRERARVVELRALYASGRATEALARCHEHRRRLVEELGVDPSPLLRQVELDILDHRLPLAQVAAGADAGRRLPALPVTTFVGRTAELAAVVELLDGGRIVTITGPGGVGKTRLALHAAHHIAHRYPAGVWWCDLVSASGLNVADVVAAGIGLQDRLGERMIERLAGYLGAGRVMLVLDNCEEVAADIGALVDALVPACPQLDVLATCRQPLGCDGERRLRLRPLAVDSAGDAASPALELFVDRAGAATPGLAVDGAARDRAVEVCRAVGGLPLAIELAAASSGRYELDALAARLSTRLDLIDRATGPSGRHGSVEGVLESSYRTLERDEQTLLDRLSVFAGPFGVDDVEALDADAPLAGLGRALGALVDKSMVPFHPDAGHYELLPPVRALARAHLARRGELERWTARHTAVVLARTGRLDADLRTSAEPRAARAVDAATADLRAVHARLCGDDDVTLLTALSASLHYFAMLRNRSELIGWATELVPRCAGHPDAGRARASAAIGAAKRGDLAAAGEIASMADLPALEQRFSTEILAHVYLYDGRLHEAAACSRQASGLHAEAGDEVWAINAASVEVVALAYAGHRRDAEELARPLVARADRAGAPSSMAMTRYVLAETLDDPIEAARAYRQSISLGESIGADFVTGVANTSLAALELRVGRTRGARRRLAWCIEHWQRAGVRTQQWLAIRLLIDALDESGEYQVVATLGAAYAASRYAGPAFGDDAMRLADALARAARRLGEDRAAAAAGRGARLDDDQAALLAAARARQPAP